MSMSPARAIAQRLRLSVAATVLLSGSAWAASDRFLTPDTSNPTNVTFQGSTFVNQGMVGAGRVRSNLLDFRGETLGSFSGMAPIRETWRRNGDSYSGGFFTLPDRGYNVGTVFSDYAARLHQYGVGFTPYTGTANLPNSAASQNQLTLTPQGGFVFTDFLGQTTTGNNPGANIKIENGFSLPSPATGLLGAGKISFDSEAVAFLNDGSFYIGDEYSGGVYYFDATGRMAGYLEPENALLPKAGTTLNFGVDLNTVGRRTNQGMEGVTVTPDGKQLFAVLQSATRQDSNDADQQSRNNTRVMVYDISQTRTPANPIGHYVLQLPVLDRDGTGPNPDRTAAQSEVLALNSEQFLLLTRDGNGLGAEDNRPLVFKSVYLVDITGATNLAGTSFETTTASVVTGFTTAGGGTLNSTITPVKTAELVNLINPTQLQKFGFTTAVTPLNPTAPTTRIPEKWESMALLPVLEEDKPQDFFLFVGNDNDFATPTGCVMAGVANCNGPLVNDNVMMVWRLTLPTYVDPAYLQSMLDTGPALLTSLSLGARNTAKFNGANVADHLTAGRYGDIVPAQAGLGVALWGAGSFSSLKGDNGSADIRGGGATVGVELGFGDPLSAGAAVGYFSSGAEIGPNDFDADYRSLQVSGYVSYRRGGLFANLAGTYADLNFSNIVRPAAYGTSALSETDGSGRELWGEVGYLFNSGNLSFGPVAGFRWLGTEIDDFTETGAAGGNVTYPKMKVDGTGAFFGGEFSAPLDEGVRPILRLTYETEDDDTARNVTLGLASAQHAMGTQAIALPDMNQNHVNASLMLTGKAGSGNRVNWFAGYSARLGIDGGTQHRVSAGFSFVP